jgi:spore coat polysaccharide biosynthesis protein SpsF
MRIGGIIFSRISSTRLPGKALKEIYNKTLIERVIERAKEIKKINHLCIATSNQKSDDVIADFALSHGIDVYRGSLNNVLERALKAAEFYKYDSFFRICGDRPFFDHSYYDQMIEEHLKEMCDLTTNIFPRTVPQGYTGEVIKTLALKKTLKMTNKPQDLEHVTRFFYRNASLFSIKNISFSLPKHIVDLKLVIDDMEDYNRAEWILKTINDRQMKENSQTIFQLAMEWENNQKIKS